MVWGAKEHKREMKGKKPKKMKKKAYIMNKFKVKY